MFKKLAIFLGTLLAWGLLAPAQEVHSEVTFSATGIFTSPTSSDGLQHQATKTGGVLGSYRMDLRRWAAVEVNYGWNRNSQEYFTAGLPLARVQSDIHQVTADFVAKFPTFRQMRPYLLGGGGALIFDPTGAGFAALPTRITTRGQGAFVYGGGVDFDLTNRGAGKPGVGLRVGYRGYVYGVPNFGSRLIDLRGWTHTAQPEAGLIFRF